MSLLDTIFEPRADEGPVVPERDLLYGHPTENVRHALARAALLRCALAYRPVRNTFETWGARYGYEDRVARAAAELDALAARCGLTGRAALFAPEVRWAAALRAEIQSVFAAFLDETSALAAFLDGTSRAAAKIHSALVAFLDGTPSIVSEAVGLACGLGARVGDAPGGCVWFGLELLNAFFDRQAETVTGRPIPRAYTTRPAARSPMVNIQLQPTLSRREALREVRRQLDRLETGERPRRRAPKHGGAHYIDRDVTWLWRVRIEGVAVRALAREAGLGPDGGKTVRDGMRRALAALRVATPPALPLRRSSL